MRPVNNVADALEGQVAGVQMYKSSGDPATPSSLIRGISSINANQEPLIILDGAPFFRSWNDINPNERGFHDRIEGCCIQCSLWPVVPMASS